MKALGAAAALLLTFFSADCTPAAQDARTPSATATSTLVQPGKPAPPLAQAIRQAKHLGPAGVDTEVFLDFGLKTRQPARLAAVVASGRTVTPAEYSIEFGADPALVQHAVDYLRGAGMHATWHWGSTLIQADGPAPAVAALLRIDIESFRLANGSTFYASVGAPTLAPPLGAVINGVSGLDSYIRSNGHAVTPGGLKPDDVLAFYNLTALRSHGLDGTGQTILFPEIETLQPRNMDDLEQFAREFGLPAFGPLLTVKNDSSWGTPDTDAIETVLDLEIAHEVAPKAKLVVYQSGNRPVFANRAYDQLVTDNLGSIISNSNGICEAETSASSRDQYAGIADRSLAQGMSQFVASGDNGAYDCGEDLPLSADFPSTLPQVTSVGGTEVFESTQGIYFKEQAWGMPISQHGGGGGPSQVYPIPAWQKSVQEPSGHGFRQVPDVAADADPFTGFRIVFNGADTQIGGTSAATPLWAATIALINQDLKSKNLRQVGFANPALYWMGDNRSRLAASPFHDVTAGNNLAFSAGTGWDFATGWGSMDAGALDAAWIIYIKSGGA